MNVGVVIVCAGRGKRLGGKDKAILKLKNKLLFSYSLELFKSVRHVKQIVLVLRKKHFGLARKIITDKSVLLVKGGKERADSVFNGLCALGRSIDYVLIHDGARPFLTKRKVLDMLRELKKHPAVVCGLKPLDTVKLTRQGFIQKTINRDSLRLVQTPQGFSKELILKAYRRFKAKKLTDDAQLLELMSKRIKVIPGDRLNFKITYLQDLRLAEAIVNGRV